MLDEWLTNQMLIFFLLQVSLIDNKSNEQYTSSRIIESPMVSYLIWAIRVYRSINKQPFDSLREKPSLP